MEEAFRDGERLGEAFGNTKKEVLEKLEKAHPTADEIRIRTLKENIEAERQTPPLPELVEPLLRFFEFDHLPTRLQTISGHFHRLAHTMVNTLPRNPERTVALRKLLESKDCAVRAAL